MFDLIIQADAIEARIQAAARAGQVGTASGRAFCGRGRRGGVRLCGLSEAAGAALRPSVKRSGRWLFGRRDLLLA